MSGLAGVGRTRRWALLLLGLLALAGCTGLPVSGPVQPGRAVDDKVVGAARIVAPPPEAGADQEQIVRGFLRAGAAFQEPGGNGEIVAKAYLVPDSVPDWSPTSLVTVFDASTYVAVERLDATRLRASVAAVAIVDDTGHYRELAPGSRSDVVMTLVQIEGEWRIQLPASGFGIWVNSTDFDRIYRPYRLAYPVAGTRRLLSDVRWWPSGPRLVTALARAQVAAPPDYLKGVVETGFPETAKLAVEAVGVDAGVATVVLTPPASNADVAHRRAMWAQLAATLLVVPEVTAVTVEVQGQGRLVVPDLPAQVRSVTETGFTRDSPAPARGAIVRSGELLQRLELGRLADAPGPTLTPAPELPGIPTGYAGLAAGPDGVDLAAVTPDGRELARWRNRARVPVDGVGLGLTHPVFDGTGRLWVAGRDARDGTGAVWTIDPAQASSLAAQRIPGTWLQGRVPVAIAVSPDATRMAIVSRAADGSDARVDVAGLVRNISGEVIGLAMPMLIDAPFVRAVDVAWVDGLTLTVLGAIAAEAGNRPFVAELGQGIGLRQRGPSDPGAGQVATPPDARTVVVTGGVRGIVVVGPAGVLMRAGNGWRRVGQLTDLTILPARPTA